MSDSYNTGKLPYGVSAFVGNYIVGKLRMRVEMFTIVENYLKENMLNYEVVKINTKRGKNNNCYSYVHFNFVITPRQLKDIKVLIRRQRIKKLYDEIQSLTI
jgi:hypothetical protein